MSLTLFLPFSDTTPLKELRHMMVHWLRQTWRMVPAAQEIQERQSLCSERLNYKLSPMLSSKTYEFCIKVKLCFHLKFSIDVTTTEIVSKKWVNSHVGCNQSWCSQKGMWLSAASFGKISVSRGSHVHHNIHPLSLNIVAETLEVIIRIFAISSENTEFKLSDIKDLKKTLLVWIQVNRHILRN